MNLHKPAHFIRTHPGIWLITLALALVGGRLLWVNAGQPAHRREITAAFGSVRLFRGGLEMNRDGSKFTYVATGDTGHDLFLGDTATGQVRSLYKEHGGGTYGSTYFMRAWPWAPDDSAFIYTLQNRLVIQPGDPAQAASELTLDTNAVTDLAWLNPGEFAYVTAGTNLGYARKQPNGQWQSHDLLHGSAMVSLTAVDTHTLAWLQDRVICHLDLAVGLAGASNAVAQAPAPAAGLHPPTNGLILWLDAATVAQADQTPVTGVADLSPARNDAVPNVNPPTYNGPASPGALNGRGTLHFTSADAPAHATGLKTRANLDLTGKSPRSIFAVMRHTDNGVMRINLGDVTQRWGGFNLEDDKNSLYLPRYWKNWVTRIVVRAHDWNLVEVVADGTRHMAYVNGVLQSVKTNQMTTAAGPVEIGLRSAGKGGTNAVGADGDFAELLIYQHAMDDGDRQQVEHYLQDKWLGNRQLAQGSPLVWCNPQMTGLTGFSYSRVTGQFLLTKLENGRSSLWRFDPATNDPTPIAEAVNIVSPQWLGDNGCGYACSNAGTNAVVLEAPRGGQKFTLPVPGNLRWFQATPEGDKLLILGTFSNEPAEAVWQYDLATGKLRPLVPGSDHPSALAQNLEPSQTTLRLPSGRNVKCTLYAPPQLDAHKKYPLVLGYTHFGTFADGAFGRMWLPALAACGAYVVVVDRASWDGGIENWGENVGGAYQTLIQNPHIDAGRVYLFAASKETHYLSEFVTQAPSRWRGLILLNPSELPDFAGTPRLGSKPKILISAGAEEHEETRLINYQDDSLKSGVMVDTEVAAGESHMFVGNLAQLERTRAMMHFIFEE
jgi:hypothetical protein